jgi:hypothetical protein
VESGTQREDELDVNVRGFLERLLTHLDLLGFITNYRTYSLDQLMGIVMLDGLEKTALVTIFCNSSKLEKAVPTKLRNVCNGQRIESSCED